MPEGDGEGRPGRELAKETRQAVSEHDNFADTFWNAVVDRSSVSPAGEDPAFWPVRILDEFNYLLVNRATLTDPRQAEFADRLFPLKKSIKRIKTAYEIVAYPHCENEQRRGEITRQLSQDQQSNNYDHVSLNDEEAGILHRLCETPRYAIKGTTTMRQPAIRLEADARAFHYAAVLGPKH